MNKDLKGKQFLYTLLLSGAAWPSFGGNTGPVASDSLPRRASLFHPNRPCSEHPRGAAAPMYASLGTFDTRGVTFKHYTRLSDWLNWTELNMASPTLETKGVHSKEETRTPGSLEPPKASCEVPLRVLPCDEDRAQTTVKFSTFI